MGNDIRTKSAGIQQKPWLVWTIQNRLLFFVSAIHLVKKVLL